MNKNALVLLILSVALAAAGCGKGPTEPNWDNGGATTPPQTKTDPVTLDIASAGASTVLDEDFQVIVNEYVAKKYPHITLNFLPESGGTTVDNLLVAGTVPDMVVTFNGNLASYKEKGLVFDMTPQLETHHIDMERFEPNYIADIRNASDKGELFGLPINVNYHAMYYNKDIFDKFGTPYPEDGMTWEQVVALAKKVSRKEDGTQYRGLDPGNSVIWMSQPLGIAAIDPYTDKATVITDQWKRVFELAKSIYDIPGNGLIAAATKNQFMKDKTLAILLDLNILTQLTAAQGAGLNWDVAQYPSYSEKPNTYGNASVYVMFSTKTGKHQDDVVKVIDLIGSEEVQLALSKIGRLSPLKSGQVKQALGSNNPQLKGKRLPSIFKSHPVPYPRASQYRNNAEVITINKFKTYLSNNVDVNTVLKQTEEEINRMVETEKGKSK